MTWTMGADVASAIPGCRLFPLRILERNSCAEVTWTDRGLLWIIWTRVRVPGLFLPPPLARGLKVRAYDLANPYPRLPMDILAHVPMLQRLEPWTLHN